MHASLVESPSWMVYQEKLVAHAAVVGGEVMQRGRRGNRPPDQDVSAPVLVAVFQAAVLGRWLVRNALFLDLVIADANGRQRFDAYDLERLLVA